MCRNREVDRGKANTVYAVSGWKGITGIRAERSRLRRQRSAVSRAMRMPPRGTGCETLTPLPSPTEPLRGMNDFTPCATRPEKRDKTAS